MNFLDRIVASVSPERALKRMAARKAMMHYAAAGYGRRSRSWRADGSDADGAAARRERLAFITRDMIRNTPYAARAQQVIVNNVVGDGIIPKVVASAGLRRQGLDLIERHLDTVAIDAAGRLNLYGLQRLAMNAVVESGEVLIRRRRRRREDGLPLPFQIEVLEPDYLDTMRDGPLPNGNHAREGIEFDLIGRRVAYYLWDEHPGQRSGVLNGIRMQSRRVPASEVLHIYRPDRPGQVRGVPWMAAIALNLQDLGDHQDAELMRQKIAACFAAFRRPPDGADDSTEDTIGGTLKPGAIYNLSAGEDISFGTPPKVDGFEEFSRVVLRSVAAGLGITYEALTGDLSTVNFSSARMGRMEMDRNVSSWQWTLMVPQFLAPFGEWFKEAWAMQAGTDRADAARLEWVPPHRTLVDPTREIPALRDKVRAGFASRQGVVRELGYDPERLMEEIREDRESADAAGVQFDSDPRSDANRAQQAPQREQDEGDTEDRR